METAQALTAQKVDDLRASFDQGMTNLKDELKERDARAEERHQQERQSYLEEVREQRKDRRWFWQQVFAIILAILGAGGFAGYWAFDAPPAAAPAPPPAAPEAP